MEGMYLVQLSNTIYEPSPLLLSALHTNVFGSNSFKAGDVALESLEQGVEIDRSDCELLDADHEADGIAGVGSYGEDAVEVAAVVLNLGRLCSFRVGRRRWWMVCHGRGRRRSGMAGGMCCLALFPETLHPTSISSSPGIS